MSGLAALDQAVVDPREGWKRVSQFICRRQFDRAKVKYSSERGGRVLIRLVDDVPERTITTLTARGYPNEIVVATMALLADRMPEDQAVCSLWVCSLAGQVTVYSLELHPEPSAVDQLGDLTR